MLINLILVPVISVSCSSHSERLSSLRNKGQGHASHTASRLPPHGDISTRHMIRTDIPSTSGKVLPSSPSSTSSVGEDRKDEAMKPKVPPKMRRQKVKQVSSPSVINHQQQIDQEFGMRTSQSMDPIPFHGPGGGTMDGRMGSIEALRLLNYVPAPGNFSSLPRTNSQSSSSDDTARGTKPYSSARYPSMVPPKPHTVHGSEGRRILSLSRNASFHGTEDRHIIVSPLDKNPAMLSEETDDDSYLYRKGSAGRMESFNYHNVSSPGRMANPQSSNYQNVPPSPGMGVVPKSMPFPLIPPHRRRHDVILEDPLTPNVEARTEGLEPDSTHDGMMSSPATFPRQVPQRSHSMHVQGEWRGRGQYTLPPESENAKMMIRDKSVCLRRGGSLHGPTDYRPGASFPIAASGFAQQSVKDHQAEASNGEADDHLSELSGPIFRQHRRTRSYEPANISHTSDRTLPKAVVPTRRGVSEYYPPPSVEEESSTERSPPPVEVSHGEAEVTSTVTYVGAAQDINQQVCELNRRMFG